MHASGVLVLCSMIAGVSARPATEITVPEGFEVDLLHEATPEEGSWSAMTFDGSGRVIISPQSGPLLRLTLPETGGESCRIEPLHDRIGSAQGLLAVGHDLYVNVADDPDRGGGLWRLRDLDADDRYEVAERLAAYGSRSEHGPHGLVLGPDGHLWMVNGNYTPLPEARRVPSPFAGWAEDDVLERIWDPRGHAHGLQVPAGVLLRTDLEAREWEVVAGGMRNPYDLDFNRDGELFTYDADMEWDFGTPWYRSPRFLHLVSGAEYGWRSGSAKWPVESPDAFPAVREMDAGSPTGVASGHRSGFPPPWDRSMFLGDWAYGRILAVELVPDGGTYEGVPRTFLAGRPLNVTDFDFGPDGHLYLVTGGRGSASRLYRVRWVGGETPETIGFDRRAHDLRAARRSMEESHVSPGSIEFDELVHGLGDRDLTIRHAARIGLEHWLRDRLEDAPASDLASSVSRLEQLPPEEGGWEALLACIRTLDTSRTSDLYRWLDDLSVQDESEAGSLWFGRLAGVLVARHGIGSPASARVRSRLREVFPTGVFSTDRHLVEVMVRLGGADLDTVLLDSIDADTSTVEIMHRLHALSQLDGAWKADRDGMVVDLLLELDRATGGASHTGYVDAIRKRIEPHLGSDAAGRLAVQLADAAPNASGLEGRRTVRAWTTGDLEPHLSRVLAGRDHARGRAMYDTLQCAACHRVGDHGVAYGPDLTGAGARFGLRDLLVATLEPDRDISDQYEAALIETHEGEQHLGLVVERDDAGIVLAPDPRTGETRRVVPVDDVRRETVSSPMPSGLLDTADMEEILDLLAYLIAAGDPDDGVYLPQP